MALSITDLPKEVLALIFENLTKPNDRRRAAQVCKLFYVVIRHQSTLKRDNVLKLQESATNPIRVFENADIFPFSKLHIEAGQWHQNVILESAFWSVHGQKIKEIYFNDKNVHIENVLPLLNDYFPNLKKLTIVARFSTSSDCDNNWQNISLSIEDLSLVILDVSVDHLLAVFSCSPLLKNLHIRWTKVDYFPQILPWLETIESSRLIFSEQMPLEKLINLPSKVVIDRLIIKPEETPEKIREFFKQPRMIETLSIHAKTSRFTFDFNYNNPVVYFNRDQAMALRGAKSIKQICLSCGVLEFEGSMDFLGQLPGLETISLSFFEGMPNHPLYPFYWSLPETAQKVREIDLMNVSELHYLPGLNRLTSISIWDHGETPRGLSSDEIQTLIRNCPNLEELDLSRISRIDATDADLIGRGDILPLSSLEQLESLEINAAPNITLEAFKSAFKFLNLKSFKLWNYNSSEEQPFNQDVAKLFTQNCPNLEYLAIYNCPVTEEGFDYLIRHLPYLRDIKIKPKNKGHPLSKDKITELQREFPYIKIRVIETTSE